MPRRGRTKATKAALDLDTVLDVGGVRHRLVKYPRHGVIYSQGATANDVLYIARGGIKLSVTSALGKDAVTAMLGHGDFFGEGCLAGQPHRTGTATALVPTEVVRIPKAAMARMLEEQINASLLSVVLND